MAFIEILEMMVLCLGGLALGVYATMSTTKEKLKYGILPRWLEKLGFTLPDKYRKSEAKTEAK